MAFLTKRGRYVEGEICRRREDIGYKIKGEKFSSVLKKICTVANKGTPFIMDICTENSFILNSFGVHMIWIISVLSLMPKGEIVGIKLSFSISDNT